MNDRSMDNSGDYSLGGLIDWRPVEKALEERTACGNKCAIIETNKILGFLLEERRFPGNTFEERYRSAKNIFTNIDKTQYAVTMYTKIISERDFELEPEDVRDIISAYYQAMIDVHEYSPSTSLGILKKWKLIRSHRHLSARSIAKRIGVGLLLFLFLVFILDRTTIGRSLVEIVITIANFMFTKLVIIALVIVAFFMLLFASLHHMNKKKDIDKREKKEKERTDETKNDEREKHDKS